MIGIKLKKLRKQHGYSLRQLAKRTKLSHSFISDIEHGRCNPSINSLLSLASAFNINPDFFLADVVAEGDHKATSSEHCLKETFPCPN